MIEEDLSRVEESATKTTYRLGVGFERCEDKGEKSALKFIPSSTYHKEEAIIKSIKAHYPSNPKPSFNSKRQVRKEIPKPREEAFICMFCGHLALFLVLRLALFLVLLLTLSHVLCLALLLVLHLSSLMDPTIAHMVLVHERTASSLDALVTAHILIVMIVSHVSLIFSLEGPFPTLS
jgi:hypothetical protein